MNNNDTRNFSSGRSVPGNYFARGGMRGSNPGCGCSGQAPSNPGNGCGCEPCRQSQISCACPLTCDQSGDFNHTFALAMSYTPLQSWNGISDYYEGLQNGTIFPELVKPFCAAGRRKS